MCEASDRRSRSEAALTAVIAKDAADCPTAAELAAALRGDKALQDGAEARAAAVLHTFNGVGNMQSKSAGTRPSRNTRLPCASSLRK